ncbi:MAG: type II toxin-antitoxin system VapC family toxin [Deltaproteobacteria bacterium]|nr:type II toxin-antitoxin system VapC family toxin [Deltaproteobacteria bacterium]MBF0525566.1 type II toxin-antitoxin system VapC family toxin [Deltaproteobacteria bacterium]
MTENKIILDSSFVSGIIGIRESLNDDFYKYVPLVFRSKLIAPKLIDYEVGNMILKHCRYKKVDSEVYFSNFERLRLTINLIGLDDLRFVYEVAEKYRLSFYDAAYVAILNQEKADLFLTFDGDFKKVEDERVKVIG